VVPEIDLLSRLQGLEMMSLMRDVLEDPNVSSLGSRVTYAAKSLLDDCQFNEEQAKVAYSHIFKFLQEQEGGGGPGWKPSKTGLDLVPAPPGKGRAMWVSKEGREQFQLHGEDVIRKIGR
jgi:hypothetical protein